MKQYFFTLLVCLLFSCTDDNLSEPYISLNEDQFESKLLCHFGNNVDDNSMPSTNFEDFFQLVNGAYVIKPSGWDPCNVVTVCYGMDDATETCVPVDDFSLSANQCEEWKFFVFRDCGAPCSGWFVVPPSCVQPSCGQLDFSWSAFFEITDDCGGGCACCYKRKLLIGNGNTCNLASTSITTHFGPTGEWPSNEFFEVNGTSRWCPSQTRCVTVSYVFDSGNASNGCNGQGQGNVCEGTICLSPPTCFSNPPSGELPDKYEEVTDY